MGIKERRAKEKAHRRATIMEAAKEVFFRNGFTATTMNQIAEAAELSKGTLYLYFASKQELYVSLFLEGLDILLDAFQEATRHTSSWEARLRNIGWAYYRYFIEYRQYFHLNFQFQQGDITADISQELFQACVTKGSDCLAVITRAIQAGMDRGEIPPQNPMELASVLWGSLNGIILLHEGEGHRAVMGAPLEPLIRRSIDLLVTGLKNLDAANNDHTMENC